MRTGGRTLRKLASSEDLDPVRMEPERNGDTHSRLDLPLPVEGAWTGLLRTSRFDHAAGWSAGDRQFLEAVASLIALAVERQVRPNGVRELRGVLQRALTGIMNDALGALDSRSGEPLRPSEKEDERIIQEVLRSTGGNRTAAAKLLGMSRVTLWKRLKAMRTEPASIPGSPGGASSSRA